MKKALSSTLVKFALGGVLLAALLAAGSYYGARALPIEIRIGATAGAAAAEPAHAASEKAPAGISYILADRVVNLADQGGYRYLKIGIGLEFAAEEEKELSGEAYKKKQEEFGKKLGSRKERLEDVITTTLSSRTSAQLASAAGKEELRAELRERVAAAAQPERLLGVYFTQFIIQ